MTPAPRKPSGARSKASQGSKRSGSGNAKAQGARSGRSTKSGAGAAPAAATATPARTLRIGTLKPAKGATHRRKRRGLGPASGLGGTAGRGHKGQRARKSGNVPRWFEGGQMPIQRRLPKVGFTNIHRVPHQVVNVENLARFGAGETVNRETLKAKRLIDRSDLPVKILGDGELTLALLVFVDAVSASARQKIEAAGGTVTLPERKTYRPRGVKKSGATPGPDRATRG